jgi:hypothetical protein
VLAVPDVAGEFFERRRDVLLVGPLGGVPEDVLRVLDVARMDSAPVIKPRLPSGTVIEANGAPFAFAYPTAESRSRRWTIRGNC